MSKAAKSKAPKKKDYFFHQDNTHKSGVNVVTLKIAGLTARQYEKLKLFVDLLAREP